MARRRTATALAPRTRVVSPRVQIVRVPSAGGRVAKRAGRGIRRGTSAAAQSIRDEKHTLTAILASGALGLAKRQGIALPKIDQIGTPGTYGLGAWVLARMTKNKTIAHVATGLLSVASYTLAAGDAVTGDGDTGDEW